MTLRSSAAVPSVALEEVKPKQIKIKKKKETHRFRIIKDDKGNCIPQEKIGPFWFRLYEGLYSTNVHFCWTQCFVACTRVTSEVWRARNTIKLRKEYLESKKLFKKLKKEKGTVVEEIE